MTKERIDRVVVERGLAESRARAQAMIMAGQVLVGEQRVDKPGLMVDIKADIRIKGETLRYVGRGGLKLDAALEEFNVSVADKTCLDVGASTGGFTDCMLQRGARRVWALDVGHNQLAWRMRQDSRVVVMEGINARTISPNHFPVRFDFAAVDVSFISLTKILRPVISVVSDDASIIALIKPQFEVGKGEVGRGGIVTDPVQHKRVLTGMVEFVSRMGLHPAGLIQSPILGAEGNKEFLIHLTRRPSTDARTDPIGQRILALTTR